MHGENITATTVQYGAWTSWSDYGDCTESCDGGTQTRSRTCTQGTGGELCPGDASQQRSCNTFSCPGKPIWAGEMVTILSNVARVLLVMYVITGIGVSSIYYTHRRKKPVSVSKFHSCCTCISRLFHDVLERNTKRWLHILRVRPWPERSGLLQPRTATLKRQHSPHRRTSDRIVFYVIKWFVCSQWRMRWRQLRS